MTAKIFVLVRYSSTILIHTLQSYTCNMYSDSVQFQSKKEPKKTKYTYKTVEDVIASGGKKRTVVQSELSKVKVIDMTGKEKRVLSGYHAISNKHDKPDDDEILDMPKDRQKRAFDMPELLHNLDLLVEMAEDEILQNNKK